MRVNAVTGPSHTGGVPESPVLPVWNLPQSFVCLQGKTVNLNYNSNLFLSMQFTLTVTFSLSSSISGLAVSASSELLRLQTNREKCVYSVHVGCVNCLSGVQYA